MVNTLHVAGLVVLGPILLVGVTAAKPVQQAVNRQAAAVAEFDKNVKAYMDVRQKAVSGFHP